MATLFSCKMFSCRLPNYMHTWMSVCSWAAIASANDRVPVDSVKTLPRCFGAGALVDAGLAVKAARSYCYKRQASTSVSTRRVFSFQICITHIAPHATLTLERLQQLQTAVYINVASVILTHNADDNSYNENPSMQFPTLKFLFRRAPIQTTPAPISNPLHRPSW